MRSFENLENFNEKQSQEAVDLSLHAMRQLFELLERTIALVDNPLAKMLIAENLAVAALIAQTKLMLECAESDGVEASFDKCLQWSIKRLHANAINFMKVKT